jgi:hypothetical protein
MNDSQKEQRLLPSKQDITSIREAETEFVNTFIWWSGFRRLIGVITTAWL